MFNKLSLNNTKLPVMEISSNHETYGQINLECKNCGSEGSVYRYNSEYAFKIFNYYNKKRSLIKKFQKIELLAKLEDKSFAFPIGLVGFENRLKEGYYMNIVEVHKDYPSFMQLWNIKDRQTLFDIVIKADAAMQRAHKMGIIMGDIKENNILIDENNNPIFIDTDNYAYGDFKFDLYPYVIKNLKNYYGKKFSLIDTDKYLYALMVLKYMFSFRCYVKLFTMNYKAIINSWGIDPELKEGLIDIFSDSEDKPYIGPILKRINPEQKFFSPIK